VACQDAYPALRRLKEQGLARHIGITGLPFKIFPSILERVEPGTVETILSFCRYQLNDNSLADLIPYLKAKGVGIINAAPAAPRFDHRHMIRHISNRKGWLFASNLQHLPSPLRLRKELIL